MNPPIVTKAEQWEDTFSITKIDLRDLLEQYAREEMPKVHHAHLTAALSGIDLDVIGEWEALLSSKLLAQPFGGYAANLKNHQKFCMLIFKAIIDITKTKKVSICAPQQSQTSKKTLISFFIYNLTKTQQQMLLHCSIWSSKSITFQVLQMNPNCPDFLFTIKDLTTLTT